MSLVPPSHSDGRLSRLLNFLQAVRLVQTTLKGNGMDLMTTVPVRWPKRNGSARSPGLRQLREPGRQSWPESVQLGHNAEYILCIYWLIHCLYLLYTYFISGLYPKLFQHPIASLFFIIKIYLYSTARSLSSL